VREEGKKRHMRTSKRANLLKEGAGEKGKKEGAPRDLCTGGFNTSVTRGVERKSVHFGHH